MFPLQLKKCLCSSLVLQAVFLKPIASLFIFCRLIKMSSPNINNIILIGCIIMYVSVFVQEQNEQQVRSFCRVCAAMGLYFFWCMTVADLRVSVSDAPLPPRAKIYLFSCSFWEKKSNLRLAPHSLENHGSATA